MAQLVLLLAAVFLGAAVAQDDAYRGEGQAYSPPTSFNFNDLPVVEAPKPPFLDLPAIPSNDNPQSAQSAPGGGQQYQLVTKVFTLPNGAITTLQVPQYNMTDSNSNISDSGMIVSTPAKTLSAGVANNCCLVGCFIIFFQKARQLSTSTSPITTCPTA